MLQWQRHAEFASRRYLHLAPFLPVRPALLRAGPSPILRAAGPTSPDGRQRAGGHDMARRTSVWPLSLWISFRSLQRNQLETCCNSKPASFVLQEHAKGTGSGSANGKSCSRSNILCMCLCLIRCAVTPLSSIRLRHTWKLAGLVDYIPLWRAPGACP